MLTLASPEQREEKIGKEGENVVNADLEISRGMEQSRRGGQDGGEIEGLIEVEGKYKYAESTKGNL